MPNPGDRNSIDDAYRHGDGRYKALSEAEQAPAGPQDDANSSDSAARARGAEEGAGGWRNNTAVDSGKQSATPGRSGGSMRMMLRRRGPAIGVGGGLIGFVVFVMFMLQGTLLQHIVGNIMDFGDWGTPALERRFRHTLRHMNNTNAVECGSTRRGIGCRMGQMSNQALNRLERRAGVVANYDTQSDRNSRNSGRYPNRNPTSYTFPDGQQVARTQLATHLQNNPRHAQMMLGRQGAMNLRFSAWTGKHMSARFFDSFRVGRTGGIADGRNRTTGTSGNMADDARVRGNAANPNAQPSGEANRHRLNLAPRVQSLQRGGTYYLLSALGCLVAKAPTLIAISVAAEQIARLVWFTSYFLFEPESKARAHGVDESGAIGFDAEDMEAAGRLLTEPVEDDDGQMRAAVDSPLLQQAMGMGGRADPSESWSPGLYAIRDLLSQQESIDNVVGGACSVILSPTAMYTAMAVNLATSGRRAVPFVAAFEAAVWIANRTGATGWVFEKIGEQIGNAAVALADLPDIEDIQGRELGDALGVGAMAFMSSGAAARHLPPLSQEDSLAWMQTMEEQRREQREMDIAALSPWDTSSQYTFLGGIQHQLYTAMIASSGSGTTPLTVFNNIIRLPAQAIQPGLRASALPASLDDGYCSYAETFGLQGDAEEGIASPGITAAGTPCYGLTPRQAAMTTQQAIDIVEEQGWVASPDDPDVDIEDAETIDDLIAAGYILEGTPMYDYIEECGDLTSADYLMNTGGCMIGSSSVIESDIDLDFGCVDEEGNIMDINECLDRQTEVDVLGGGYEEAGITRVDDDGALDAIPVFLIDFQVAMAFNGYDDEEPGDSQVEIGPSDPTAEISDHGGPNDDFVYPVNPNDPGTRRSCGFLGKYCPGYGQHRGQDYAAPAGTSAYALRDATVILAGVDPVMSASNCAVTSWKGETHVVFLEYEYQGEQYQVRYSHMTPGTLTVQEGDTVVAGQRLGDFSMVGCSTGSHLHIDIATPTLYSGGGYYVNTRDPEIYLGTGWLSG